MSRLRTADPGAYWGMALAALTFVLALRPVVDFDTYWQLQSGRYMVETRAFIYRDTFSLAADAFRLEHCWLHDLLLYGLYVLGGYHLLSLLLAVVIAACIFLLYRWNRQSDVDPTFILPMLTLCVLASLPSWALRPQLWTFLFSLLYLYLLHKGRINGWRSWLWLVPVMLLWANLHAGCVFGLVLISLFGMGELVRLARRQTDLRSIGQLVFAGLLAFGVAFVNPYGWRIPLGQLIGHLNQYKVQTGAAGIGMLGNMEWLPPTFAQVPVFYVIILLWGVLLAWRWRRLDPAEVIFFTAFAYLGFGQIRHTTLVSLLAGFYLPLALQQVVLSMWQEAWARRLQALIIGGGSLLLLGGFLAWGVWQGVVGWGESRKELPAAATDFVLEQQLPKNLFNSYDWGGYLMWRLYAAGYLVFVDGRQDSTEHFAAAIAIDDANSGWQEILDRYQINTILTRTCFYDTGGPLNLVSALSRQRDWALVYRDDVALVYVRRAAASAAQLARELPPQAAFETMLAEASHLYAGSGVKSRALLSMGRAAFQLGRYPEARDYFRRYLEKDPANREAQAALAILQGR